MPESSEAQVFHNLFSREIRPIRDLGELFERWQAAVVLEEMLGLLHVGFDVPLGEKRYGWKEYDTTDRLAFFFTNGDGWCDQYLLTRETDAEKTYGFARDQYNRPIFSSMYPHQLRQVLARKAFDMLCLHFFKMQLYREDRQGDGFAHNWEHVVTSERLFHVLMNFFKAQEESYGSNIRIRNLTPNWDERSHNEQHAVGFLLNLARFMWGWREQKISTYSSGEIVAAQQKRNLEMRTRLDGAKPWMLEVLANLHQLDLIRPWILSLDQACLSKLREIAFRTELRPSYAPVQDIRRVATLDEACFAGSRTAWFLKEHELKTREHTRLDLILQAEQQEKEARRKIEELTQQQ